MDKKITDVLAAKVLSLYKQGFSCKDISQSCKLPVLSIRQYLQGAGYNTRSYRKASDANKAKVLLLIKAGYSYSQIEEFLHVSTHLIRLIVSENGLVGFAPRYHHPIDLNVNPDVVSFDRLYALRIAYLSGNSGLAKAAEANAVSNDEFLWFVYHLSEEDKALHHKELKANMKKMYKDHIPVTAIAKTLDVSPSIVKKLL